MAHSAESKSKRAKRREMDGAYFSFSTDKDKTPNDFLDGPDGIRPGEQVPPRGTVKIGLKHGINERTLPPRFIWEKGSWDDDSSFHSGWNVWVVSGEGTPGNYEKREYDLPDEIAAQIVPKHPADWPEKHKKPSSGSSWKKDTKTTTSSLPWGLRIRCPACGHFYKMSDLSEHAKNACPAAQDKPAMWVIECECHPNDLLTAAEVLPGFPVEAPKPKGEEAPDTSGAEQEPAADDNMEADLQPVKGD